MKEEKKMRNRKRWAAVLLACSLAFSAVGDTRLIVHANEMWEEAGQEEYSVEVEKKSVKSKNKLDDLKENAVLFQEFQGEEQKFDGTRAVDVSEHAEKVHVVNTGSVVLRFKASNNAGGVLLGTKDQKIDPPQDLGRGKDCTSFFIKDDGKFRTAYQHTAVQQSI